MIYAKFAQTPGSLTITFRCIAWPTKAHLLAKKRTYYSIGFLASGNLITNNLGNIQLAHP